VGTAPDALDEDLRASLAELDQAELPPITVAEAAAAIHEVLAAEEAEGAASASTLNPLMGGAMRPTASITSIRAAQTSSGRRLSVTAASGAQQSRAGNPLFSSAARRTSLGFPPPGSVAQGVLPLGQTLATASVTRVEDFTPPAIAEERPSEMERPSEI
jgi:hypothetical protein